MLAKRRNGLALVMAVLAVWRMPMALGLAQTSMALAAHAVSIALAMGLFFLLRRAFQCEDKRLWRVSAVVGLMFALFVTVGEPLRQTGELPTLTLLVVMTWLLDTAIYTLVAASALTLLYQAVERLTLKARPDKEGMLSRLSGNGFIVFALLLICWLPVWLAFYPGTFTADSATQLCEYLYDDLSPHHPMLHTLLLGSTMGIGIDYELEGYAAAGLAIYSVVQMVLMAGMLAYACHWLRRRGAPLWARVSVMLLFALFPFFGLWSFFAQKDVLFGGLAMLFVLQLVDVWEQGFAGLKKPLRILAFVVNAALMMLMRNNGVYALALLLPLVIALAKGARVRMPLLLVGCMMVYLVTNGWMVNTLAAREGDADVEILSIPLQQLARTVQEDENALPEDVAAYLAELYPDGMAEVYAPQIADPVKWAMDSELLDLPKLLGMWLRVGVGHLQPYTEAFLVQNLPYYLPGSAMRSRFELGIRQVEDELYWIEEHSYLPQLKEWLTEYDETLTLFGLPFVRLLSDTAFHVWVLLAALGLAIYRRQRQWITALGFLVTIWLTCLLGPVAIMRYMLSVAYTLPIALAAMLSPSKA